MIQVGNETIYGPLGLEGTWGLEPNPYVNYCTLPLHYFKIVVQD